MTLSQIIAEVYVRTRRPELIADTASAVRKATMKCHLADEFKRDLTEAIITVPVQTDFHYQLDLSNAINYPRFRKVAYVKEYNNPLVGNEIEFDMADAASLMDDYNLEQQNIWYQVGLALNITSFKQLGQVRVGYYQYPDINTATYTSWVANEFPDAIIEEAAATIFNSIGKDSEYKTYSAYFLQNLAMLQGIGL